MQAAAAAAAAILAKYGIGDIDLLQHPIQVIDQLLVLDGSLDARQLVATRFDEEPALWESAPLLSLAQPLPAVNSRSLVRYDAADSVHWWWCD